MAEAPQTTGSIPERLLILADAPASASLGDIWRALSRPERAKALEFMLESNETSNPEGLRNWAIRCAASTRHFRDKTVRNWPNGRLAAACAAELRPPHDLIENALVRLHLDGRRDMLAAYLGQLGVPNDRGQLTVDADEIDVDPTAASVAFEGLLEHFDPRLVLTYGLTLACLLPTLAPGVESWLPAFLSGVDVDPEPGSADEEFPESEPDVETTDQFTTLDRALIRTIVAAAQDVTGSFDHDGIRDLVDELLELNIDRHRSYFHLGFADVLVDREPRDSLPAQNRSRLQWYWAGAITALAREEDWNAISDAFDAESVVQELGRSGRGASSIAIPLVFDALTRTGRFAEAARFISLAALLDLPTMVRPIHTVASELLREDRAAEAEPHIELLQRLDERLGGTGQRAIEPIILDIRRRRAHFHRQRGDFARAQEVLAALLDVEKDPDLRAMVLADLGLIAGEYRRLAEIRMPGDPDAKTEVQERLDRASPRCREALEIGGKYSGHGAYVLGMAAVLGGAWVDAQRHLEIALAQFEQEAGRYHSGGLLHRARLFTGIATLMTLEEARASRGAELVCSSLSTDNQPPNWMLPAFVEHVALLPTSYARRVLETLTSVNPAVLDHPMDEGLLSRSTVLIDQLLGRVADEDLPRSDRAAMMRRMVPVLIAAGRKRDAARMLDSLEEWALDGIATEDYLELVADSRRVDPAWSPTEATASRVLVLKSIGRFPSALALLSEEFHRTLAAPRPSALDEARGLLAEMQTCASDEAALEGPTAALRAAEPTGPDNDSDAADTRLSQEVAVLFIGGDERQARISGDLKSDLEKEFPNLHVSFDHTGWSSNWGSTLEHIRERLPGYDAVVIMRFIRTEFGRQLRGCLEIPWVHCNHGGKSTMRTSILEAAEWGIRARG